MRARCSGPSLTLALLGAVALAAGACNDGVSEDADGGGDAGARDQRTPDAAPDTGGPRADLAADAALPVDAAGDAPPALDAGADAGADLLPPPDAVALPDISMPALPPPRPVPGLVATPLAGATCTGPLQNTPAVLCVDDDNTASAEQGTAAAPYRTIGAAVAAAKSGDTIQVAAGTYVEHVEVHGLALTLHGGFPGGAAGDFSSRTPASQLTTIQGAGAGPAAFFDQSVGSTLDGFRITGGSGFEIDPGLFAGGGVFVDYGQATVSNNLIEGNDVVGADPVAGAENLGGGVYTHSATVTLKGNVIRDNKAGRGGGITIDDGTAIVDGNDVTDNTSVGNHGGGIHAAGPSLKLTDNRISGNVVGSPSVGAWGGGVLIYGDGTVAELSGGVVTANSASLAGSGVFIDDGAVATLTNVLIYGNVCGADGGAGLYVDGLDAISTTAVVNHCTIAYHACAGVVSAVLVEAPATLTITNSILWSNGGDDFATIGGPGAQLAVQHSLTEEAIAGTGNLSAKPLFAAPQMGDYHLRSTRGRFDPAAVGGQGAWVIDTTNSPAIDAADPAAPVGAEPAPNGGRANLGAYGGTAQASLTP